MGRGGLDDFAGFILPVAAGEDALDDWLAHR